MVRIVVRSSLALMALAGSALAADHGVNVIAESNHRALAALEADPSLQYDPGSVLVRFSTPRAATAVPAGSVEAAASLLGGEEVQRWTLVPGLVQLTVTSMSVEDAITVLSAMPGVEFAEPDYFVHTMVTPNDPQYGSLWGMNNAGNQNFDIDGPQGWDIFTGNPNFVIGVIDTGVTMNHPDLAANIWVNPGEIAGNGIDDDGNGKIDDVNGWDFVNNDNNPTDDNGHGTHCSGTIAGVGNNGVGVTGVVWRGKIAGLKFLNSGGSGSISAALSALQYCTGKQIKVSNNSWGGGGFSQAFQNALTASAAVGHVFCAAAGNGGYNNDQTPSYPASYPNDNVIAVAAIQSNGALASFSQYGLTSVDLGGPGVNITSCWLNGGYNTISGTSMATPHVTGVVAAVYGQNPSWTYTQVRNRILSTTRPIASLNGRCVTGGLVNLRSALVDNNNPPTAAISSPSNGTTVTGGASVTFTGSASDLQDGNVTASLVWSSDLQGTIGSGGSFSTSTLMVGTHVITATASDAVGAQGTATVTVTVNSNGSVVPTNPGLPRCLRSGNGVNFMWNDVAGEVGYQVQREQRVGGVWVNTTTLGTVPANTLVFFNVPPATGQAWRYRVRGWNAGGMGAWSNWAAFSN